MGRGLPRNRGSIPTGGVLRCRCLHLRLAAGLCLFQSYLMWWTILHWVRIGSEGLLRDSSVVGLPCFVYVRYSSWIIQTEGSVMAFSSAPTTRVAANAVASVTFEAIDAELFIDCQLDAFAQAFVTRAVRRVVFRTGAKCAYEGRVWRRPRQWTSGWCRGACWWCGGTMLEHWPR